WGFNYIGHFQNFEEIFASPIQDNEGNSTLLPGDLMYEDVNGDGLIDEADLKPIGRGQSTGNNVPPYNFGFSFSVDWRGFDLSVLLQGAAGHNFLLGEQWREPMRSGNNNAYAAEFDRWRRVNPLDPKSEWAPGKYPSTRFNGTPNNKRISDFW